MFQKKTRSWSSKAGSTPAFFLRWETLSLPYKADGTQTSWKDGLQQSVLLYTRCTETQETHNCLPNVNYYKYIATSKTTVFSIYVCLYLCINVFIHLYIYLLLVWTHSFLSFPMKTTIPDNLLFFPLRVLKPSYFFTVFVDGRDYTSEFLNNVGKSGKTICQMQLKPRESILKPLLKNWIIAFLRSHM